MPIQNIQRFLVLLALVAACQLTFAQERAKIVDMPETVQIGIHQETAEAVNWGDITPGTMIRCRVSVENTEKNPFTLVRVISEPGLFTAGIESPVRDVVVEPGEKVDFYVFTSVQELGDYSLKNELIVDIDGKRQRRGVFQFQGSVIAATAN